MSDKNKTSSKDNLCKAFGLIFPLSFQSDIENQQQLAMLSEARKRELKLLVKYGAKFHDGVGFRKAAKTYLNDKRCLLDALFHENGRVPLCKRKSISELLMLADQYDILQNLNEPAKFWLQPKASGQGCRVICSFGLVAKAAQRMVTRLLRATYTPQEFQFASLPFYEKIEIGTENIVLDGLTYVTEVDIKDFFACFRKEDLEKTLPLPMEAIRQIVLAENAKWNTHTKGIKLHTIYMNEYITLPPGIPQGSASSAAVAEWCIANMKLEIPYGSTIINHADNFFAFSISKQCAQDVSKALSSGIAGLPGGTFKGKTVQSTTVAAGFKMLGCWIDHTVSDEVSVMPTDANLSGFTNEFRKKRKRVCIHLKKAADTGSKKLRASGVQEYLKLKNMSDGWLAAFACCGNMLNYIKDDNDQVLQSLRHTFDIKDEELELVQDKSVDAKIKWYSGG